MSLEFSRDLFVLILIALTGGILAKLVKLHSLVGFILAGVILKVLFPHNSFGAEKIAQLGLIFLLFTTGLELSLDKLARVARVAVTGALVQISLTGMAGFFVLKMMGLADPAAITLALGFSLSSTAVVIKLLGDKGESETIHGRVMIGWLLVQDLAVIPMMVVIGFLANSQGINPFLLFLALFKAVLAISVIFVVGRLAVPKILHWVASFNSREILLLASMFLALGTALATYAMGISPALGAFLAGVVISGSIERYTVFAEIRPLRDLFVGIFFVSLGLLISPALILANLGAVLALTAVVILVKSLANFSLSLLLGYHGKTAVAIALGLSQIGEFSFILFSLSKNLGLISDNILTVGVSSALLSLLLFPPLYRQVVPLWRRLRSATQKWPAMNKYLLGWDRKTLAYQEEFSNHIIICGYGRVGGWIGKMLEAVKTPFIVIEYNQEIVNELKEKGCPVIYGDPTEKEVLEAADIKDAKALIVAIPDRAAQEGVVTLCQTLAPQVKIISRVQSDEEWERLKNLKVDRIVQPEFEAAVAVVRSLLVSMGKSKEEIALKLKSLRQSRALSK